MTAAKAWSTALEQLRVNMPEAAHDKWVSHTVLLSAKDAAFVIAAPDSFARDWLESRLSSTVTRFLQGVCNRPVAVRFVEIKETG
jgi:chromosomal replication initiator protein